MAASGHVALGGLGGLDVDDGVEEVGFAVLTAEVLYVSAGARAWYMRSQEKAYPTDDLVVVCEMGLAVLAAVDALGVQVDVVGQAHLGERSGLAYGAA